MSELVGIFGPPATGKSTSLRNLNPEETFIISTIGKRIPIPNAESKYPLFELGNKEAMKNGHLFQPTGNPQTFSRKMCQVLNGINNNRPEIKNVVIDDFQYLLSFEYMERADESGWGKFTDIGQNAFKVLNTARTLHRDMNVFILTHVDKKATGEIGMKTIGKMLDEKIDPEGLFSVILFTHVDQSEGEQSRRYLFMTQNDGERLAKSPMGMFDDIFIDNDLQTVADSIHEYYNID